MPMGRQPSIDFPIGGIDLSQTTNAITRMLSHSDDNLLVVGYAYYDAAVLDRLGIAQWLMAKPDRHVMLILGVQGKAPLQAAKQPWNDALAELRLLLKMWSKVGVPFNRLHVYAVAHWHVKIAATLRNVHQKYPAHFTGVGPSEMNQALTYDDKAFVFGAVTEAIIGSTNATHFAMGHEGNFELDVHVQRNLPKPQGQPPLDSRPELGQLNSKIHSLLKHAIAEVNDPATISAMGTNALRTELAAAIMATGGVPPANLGP